MSVAQFGLNLGPQPSTDGAGAVEAARGEGGGGGRRHRRGLERLCALPPGPRPQRTPPPGPRPRAEPSPSPTPPQGEPGPVRTSPLPHLPKPLSSPSLRGWWVTRTGRGSPPRVGTEGGCLVINVRAGGSSVGAEQARWTRRAEGAERRGGARGGAAPSPRLPAPPPPRPASPGHLHPAPAAAPEPRNRGGALRPGEGEGEVAVPTRAAIPLFSACGCAEPARGSREPYVH